MGRYDKIPERNLGFGAITVPSCHTGSGCETGHRCSPKDFSCYYFRVPEWLKFQDRLIAHRYLVPVPYGKTDRLYARHKIFDIF